MLTFTFEIPIQIGKQCFNIIPIQLDENSFTSLYKRYFHKDLIDPECIAKKEADFLEEMICLYLREQFDNQKIIQENVIDWISRSME